MSLNTNNNSVHTTTAAATIKTKTEPTSFLPVHTYYCFDGGEKQNFLVLWILFNQAGWFQIQVKFLEFGVGVGARSVGSVANYNFHEGMWLRWYGCCYMWAELGEGATNLGRGEGAKKAKTLTKYKFVNKILFGKKRWLRVELRFANIRLCIYVYTYK